MLKLSFFIYFKLILFLMYSPLELEIILYLFKELMFMIYSWKGKVVANQNRTEIGKVVHDVSNYRKQFR